MSECSHPHHSLAHTLIPERCAHFGGGCIETYTYSPERGDFVVVGHPVLEQGVSQAEWPCHYFKTWSEAEAWLLSLQQQATP